MTADSLRDNLIDKLLTISNKDYLLALNELVEKSADRKDIVKLTKEQMAMLELSDQDIKVGRLTTNDELNNADILWLKDL